MEHHASILAELSSREPIFHRPEHGATRADFDRMTDPTFWEIGASGAIYTRAFVLDVLERRSAEDQEDIWQTSNFQLRELTPDLYLLHYDLLQNHTRPSRRTTVWRRDPDGWKIVFHQGTIVQAASPDSSPNADPDTLKPKR